MYSEVDKGELVSIIVPVYNVEKYLTECVESILAQSYEKLEIILVDDGSTDGSGKICDAYEKTDSRIRVIHKENGGLSDARNRGIEESKGAYLSFVDSDDKVHKDFVVSLIKSMTCDSDIVQCAYAKVYESGMEISYGKSCIFVDGKDSQKYFLGKEGNPEPFDIACNKIYRKTLFRDIRYPVGRVHEDIATTYQLFYKARHIKVIPDILYYYRIRSGSITQAEGIGALVDWCEAVRERVEFYKGKKEDRLEVWALKDYYYQLISCIKHREIDSEKRSNLKSAARGLAKELLWRRDYNILEKAGILRTLHYLQE